MLEKEGLSKEKVKSFYQKEYVTWQSNNPRPNTIAKGLITIPKWKGNEKITPEMRLERKNLELKNHEISKKAHEPFLKWSKDLNNFTEQWLKNHLTEDEYEIYKIYDENHWSIEEVDWLI